MSYELSQFKAMIQTGQSGLEFYLMNLAKENQLLFSKTR